MLADINLNLGDEPVPIGQQPVVPAAGGEPLVGIDFLLDAIGFTIPAEPKRCWQCNATAPVVLVWAR